MPAPRMAGTHSCEASRSGRGGRDSFQKASLIDRTEQTKQHRRVAYDAGSARDRPSGPSGIDRLGQSIGRAEKDQAAAFATQLRQVVPDLQRLEDTRPGPQHFGRHDDTLTNSQPVSDGGDHRYGAQAASPLGEKL